MASGFWGDQSLSVGEGMTAAGMVAGTKLREEHHFNCKHGTESKLGMGWYFLINSPRAPSARAKCPNALHQCVLFRFGAQAASEVVGRPVQQEGGARVATGLKEARGWSVLDTGLRWPYGAMEMQWPLLFLLLRKKQ